MRIEGMEVEGWKGEDGGTESGSMGEEEMEGLVQRLEQGLAGLKRVVDLGAKNLDVGFEAGREGKEHEEGEMVG